jgi:hypothetical protein
VKAAFRILVSVSGRCGEATAPRVARRVSQEIMPEQALARFAEALSRSRFGKGPQGAIAKPIAPLIRAREAAECTLLFRPIAVSVRVAPIAIAGSGLIGRRLAVIVAFVDLRGCGGGFPQLIVGSIPPVMASIRARVML